MDKLGYSEDELWAVSLVRRRHVCGEFNCETVVHEPKQNLF